MSNVETVMAAPEKKAAAVKKPKVTKATKEKKTNGGKASSTLSHPPYFQMIKEALVDLHERTGSSPYAIAKHMEDKHKGELPANFRKILAVQLKNFVAKGKLVRVKASFKLSDAVKSSPKRDAVKEKKSSTAVAVAKEKKPNATTGAKRKATSTTAGQKDRKPKSAKATTAKPRKAKSMKSPVKPRQPKSIKSPAAKRARRATAGAAN